MTTARPVTTQGLDAAIRVEVLKAVLDKMHGNYVFPNVVPKVEAALAEPERAHALAALSNPVTFAEALSRMLQAVAHDKHLRVRYSEAPLPVSANDGEPSNAEHAAFVRSVREQNFGVERVERLPGNIGFLELRGFMPSSLVGDAVAAAMTLLANTEALIIDLRRNGGGDPNTVALLCSYLLAPRIHLNDLVWRDGEREMFWTLDTLPGPRYGANKQVFVLTSPDTFSGAEEFSYNLRNLKRATLVGETTGGGANPGAVHRLNEHFSMFVPSGRALSPITGTNWEGTGVVPHLKVAADDALRVAQLHALKALLAGAAETKEQIPLQARVSELEQPAPTVR